jgi:hypothetical protein
MRKLLFDIPISRIHFEKKRFKKLDSEKKKGIYLEQIKNLQDFKLAPCQLCISFSLVDFFNLNRSEQCCIYKLSKKFTNSIKMSSGTDKMGSLKFCNQFSDQRVLICNIFFYSRLNLLLF